MDKAFLDWWELNKFKLIENDEVGLREIAYAGWQAGCNLKEWSVGIYECGCLHPGRKGDLFPFCHTHGLALKSETGFAFNGSSNGIEAPATS